MTTTGQNSVPVELSPRGTSPLQPVPAHVAELIIDLQSVGLRVEAQLETRKGGAGPTVIDNLPLTSEIAGAEIFGPVLSLHHVDDIDDAIALVNSGRYGNQASLFTASGASARKFRYEAEVGNVGINVGVAAPMAFFPFSGARESFFGDLHAPHLGNDVEQLQIRLFHIERQWPRRT